MSSQNIPNSVSQEDALQVYAELKEHCNTILQLIQMLIPVWPTNSPHFKAELWLKLVDIANQVLELVNDFFAPLALQEASTLNFRDFRHDTRAPLSSLRGQAELIEYLTAVEVQAEYLLDVKQIETHAFDMYKLIEAASNSS
jgi:hypothetical protein